MMEKITNTTFKEINLGDVKPVILIGGNDVDFIPNVNMSFFGDEFYINLNNKSVLKSKDATGNAGDIKMIHYKLAYKLSQKGIVKVIETEKYKCFINDIKQ